MSSFKVANIILTRSFLLIIFLATISPNDSLADIPQELEDNNSFLTKNNDENAMYSTDINQTDYDSLKMKDWEDFMNLVRFISAIVWSIILVVGVLANGCVLLVMLSSSNFTSATHYFIINLALSDLIFLIICPTLALFNFYNFIFYDRLPEFLGQIICKMDYFSTHV
jgi:hypothetical protein